MTLAIELPGDYMDMPELSAARARLSVGLQIGAFLWESGLSMRRASMAAQQVAWEHGHALAMNAVRRKLRQDFATMMAERFPELAKPGEPYYRAPAFPPGKAVTIYGRPGREMTVIGSFYDHSRDYGNVT